MNISNPNHNREALVIFSGGQDEVAQRKRTKTPTTFLSR